MKRLLFGVLFVVVTTSRALAGCDWATETPADDSKYKYLVARSYSETSRSDAANKAEQDIDAQIGRLFGTKMDVLSEFYADEVSATGTTRSYERTIGAITLKGLERQKGDVEEKSNSWIGCVQYRYLKSEIESEKKRLKNMSASDLQKSLVFTEVAGDFTCKGAPVEVVTTPSGAYVTLDNGKYQGTSPIKFGNVCNGKHSLEITHDNYEPVTQQVIVPTSGRINKTLVRATKKITVKTTLGNSRIEINGVDKGKEPVTFKAQLGIEQTITAINSEAVKITRSLTFSKDSNSTYTVPMEKLPGKVDFSAFKKRNPGVDIFIDNSKVTGDTSKELSAYDHIIKFSKSGYNDIVKTISITGGETIYYPTTELTFEKYTPPVISTPAYKKSYFGWFFGLELGKDFWGLNTGIEYQYRYDWFYVDCSLLLNGLFGSYETEHTDYYGYTDTGENDIYVLEYFRGSVGFNITHNTSLFGMFSYGTLDMEPWDYDTYSLSTNLFRYGLGIGYTSNSGFGAKAYFLTGSPETSYYYMPSNVTTFGFAVYMGF